MSSTADFIQFPHRHQGYVQGQVALQRRNAMLKWALIFAVIAVVAGLFGFTGIAAGAAGIAKILFIVFLVLCAAFVVLALLGIGAVS